jgi:diguanylate cyclase (GGDEF)-like protein
VVERDHTRQLPAALVLGGVASAFVLVFELDRSSGSSPVQHLYYLPIVVAATRFGMPGGCLAVLAAIVLYHSANPHLLAFRYEQFDLLQIAVFMAAGVLTARLTDDSRRLHQLAMTDDLTGLHNLRSFEKRLGAMVRASRDARAPLALFVLDLDKLKSLNDAYGHLTGAEAVRAVGRIIGEHTPPEAVACRYGGDEFVIAVPRCTLSQAIDLADVLRQHVNEAAPALAGVTFAPATLSVSVGVACAVPEAGRTDADSGEALFRLADAALYRAKQGGRNHVCTA